MFRIKSFWRQWRRFFLLIFLMFVFRSAIADWYNVPTGSMKPTIIEGDRIFVNKLAYDIKIPFTLVSIASWDHPERGEVIVFDSPQQGHRLIKRVVGVPGDTIAIRNNRLFINGVAAGYEFADQKPVTLYYDPRENPAGDPVLFRENFNHNSHRITVTPNLHVPQQNFGPVVVPPHRYFVLGDNRNNSADSRYIGAVHEKYILGRANRVVFSLRHWHRFMLGLGG